LTVVVVVDGDEGAGWLLVFDTLLLFEETADALGDGAAADIVVVVVVVTDGIVDVDGDGDGDGIVVAVDDDDDEGLIGDWDEVIAVL
jgi:hypothetical protein